MKKVLAALAAAAAGFAAGILTAPKSGAETRADIKQKAGEAKEFAVKQAGVVKDKASAGFAAAKKGAGTVAEDAKKAGRDVRDAVK